MRRFPKKLLKVQPVFFLLLIVKCGRKDKLRKNLISRKEPVLDNLGNHKPIQNFFNVKIKICTVRKADFGERPRVGLENIS